MLHLNGKAERSQRTDLDEFYSNVNINDPDLQDKLIAWEAYYNKEQPHSSLQEKTPWEGILDEWKKIHIYLIIIQTTSYWD